MGSEGFGSKTFFRACGRLIRGDFEFVKREYYSASDPVNAMLSFGYMLIFNELGWLLEPIEITEKVLLNNADYRPYIFYSQKGRKCFFTITSERLKKGGGYRKIFFTDFIEYMKSDL
ncbi:MAG: hypothetical protein GY749_13575 [Desulfobacteraceae bacterium]|nr:hypothetical protein [Desulfobacteraceae bacterium]